MANATNIVALGHGGFLTYSGGKIQKYDRYGDTIGSEITVSSKTIQSVTALENGDFISVVGTGASESVVLFDVSLSSATTVTVSNADATATAKVTAYDSGEFLIADGSGISKYDSNGVLTTDGFTAVSSPANVSDIITLKDGSFIAQTNTGSSAEFQRYYANGTKFGDKFNIDENVGILQKTCRELKP